MKTIVTHSGNFHSDDVFAVATLLLVYPDANVVRTRDEEEIKKADIVVDVGGEYDPSKKRFDHHQTGGAGKHENGIPYASFGLVWKEYGEKLSGSKEVAKAIETKLVFFIDALDNGVNISQNLFEDVRPYTISDYFYSYWVVGDSEKEHTAKIFGQVSGLAKEIIKQEIEKAKKIFEETKIVEQVYEQSQDKKIIVLNENLAWGKVFDNKSETLAVVYPNNEADTWSAKMVRKGDQTFETRASFPQAWAGKTDKELIKISGVPDAVFCHNARFLAIAKSKEGAIKLAEIALNA